MQKTCFTLIILIILLSACDIKKTIYCEFDNDYYNAKWKIDAFNNRVTNINLNVKIYKEYLDESKLEIINSADNIEIYKNSEYINIEEKCCFKLFGSKTYLFDEVIEELKRKECICGAIL